MAGEKTKLVTAIVSMTMLNSIVPLNNIGNIYAQEGTPGVAANGEISKDEAVKALIPENELAHKADDKEEVTIPDYNLRRGICDLLGYKDIDNAVVTKRDMRRIKYLSPEVCQAHDSTEHGVRVKNIEGLQYAENLEKLSMVNQAFDDITPLKNLIKLKHIDLRNVAKNNHGIKDLSPLKNLVKLEYLNLFKAEPTNVDELKNLVNLKVLSLGASKITNVEFAKNMVNLEYLNLEHNDFTDISPLENLVNLKTLLLDSTVKTWNSEGKVKIKDISKLSKLTKLEELGISNNDIESIDVVKNFKKLNKFHATNNNIEDFEPLLALSGLKEVWVQNNKTDIVKTDENYQKAKELFRKLNKDNYTKEDGELIDSLLSGDENVKKFFNKETIRTLEAYKEELKNKDSVKNKLFEDIRLAQISGTIEKIAKVKDIEMKVGENLEDRLPKFAKVRLKVNKKEAQGELVKNSTYDLLRIAVVNSEGNLVTEPLELVSNTGKKYPVKDGFIEVKASDAAVNYLTYSLSYNGKKVFEFYNTRVNRVGNIVGANGTVDAEKTENIAKYLVANIDKGLESKPSETPTPTPTPTPEPKPNPGDNGNGQANTAGVGIVNDEIIYKVVDESGKPVELDQPIVADGDYDSKKSTYENGVYKFRSTGEDTEYSLKLNSTRYQLVGTYSFATKYNSKLANKNSFDHVAKNGKRERLGADGTIKDKELFVITVKDTKATPEVPETPSPDTKPTPPITPEEGVDARVGVKKDSRNNFSINYKVVTQDGKEITDPLTLSVVSPNNQDIALKYNNGIYTYASQGIDDTFTVKLKSDKYELAHSYAFRDKYNMKTFKGEISSVQFDTEETTNLENASSKFFTLVVTEKKPVAPAPQGVTGFRAVGNQEATDTVDLQLPVEYDLSTVNTNVPGEYEVVGRLVHGDNIKNPHGLVFKIKVVVKAKDTAEPNKPGDVGTTEKPENPGQQGNQGNDNTSSSGSEYFEGNNEFSFNGNSGKDDNKPRKDVNKNGEKLKKLHATGQSTKGLAGLAGLSLLLAVYLTKRKRIK